ncbi:hypothetical protein C0J52_25792, partial [Blattella germanica]
IFITPIVHSFTYLGSEINCNKNVSTEIQKRIWRRMECGGKYIIENSIVYLRSRVLSNLKRSGGWSGSDIFCVQVNREQ